MELLQVKDLSFTYPKQTGKALENISFLLERGSFSLLIGESGCGKTTLLRLLKTEIAPFGEKSGEIFYLGKDISNSDVSPAAIGFVGQNPDEQIVTDKVWHELAFGPENMGVQKEVIRRRVGEMASYFGISDWYHKSTDALSGGQKQLLNLASVMVMQPKLLLLDEPTGQLDPIAAADFIATLQKLNRELGLTILLVEHRLEEVFPIADRVFAMDSGKIICSGTPECICNEMKGHPLFAGFPSAARIWNGLSVPGRCPLSVKEGRTFLDRNFPWLTATVRVSEKEVSDKAAISAAGIWFRYEKDSPDILRDMNITVREGELFSILGGNGSGKTTTLHVLAGLDRPYKGKCRIFNKKLSEYKGNSLYRHTLALLTQNPKSVFLKATVEGDFADILSALNVPKSEYNFRIEKQADKFGIASLLKQHPYDLSGGELQKCALAKLLLTEPRLIFLDEPTKGLDAYSKAKLSGLLKQLQKEGMTILIVTHDVEFAAEVSDRCGLFFDGQLLSVGTPNAFFSGNTFYTTAASRIAREHIENAVLCNEVISLCRTSNKNNPD